MSNPSPRSKDRREGRDRRAEPSPSRRAPKPSKWDRWVGIAKRDAVLIAGAVIAIVAATHIMSPVFVNQPQVAQAIAKRAPMTAKTLLPAARMPPADTSIRGQIVETPEFERDRKAFAEALVRTGRVAPARADSIAHYAVREAYVHGIPPAVVFGVMLTENAKFVSGAMSDVGAVGLMQVYPKVWLKALQGRFGKDLATDSTNIKYGTFILKEYIKTDSGAVSPSVVSKGLLRYNGCVIGAHTPNCKNYPSKVKRYVEAQGSGICQGKTFYECIARPFIAGLYGKRTEDVD
ncbi:MAG TPA: transglycosylase SLT domain-containing protein [Gemmatimonadaceae bacterium]